MNLDDAVPDPQQVIVQSRRIAAPPDSVWDALLAVAMSDLPLGLALTRLRTLPSWALRRRRPDLAELTFLEETPVPVLFTDRPRVVVSAGLSQAWRPFGGSTPPLLDAAALRAWSEPGWIKVGMEFRLEPTPTGTLLSCETRVAAVDPRTRRLFAAYWFVIGAGSAAIRCEVLRVVADRAEAARG